MMLSKSTFLKGRQCSKYLYLHAHNPSLASPDKPSVMHDSHELVETLANRLYYGGVNLLDASKSIHELAEDTLVALNSRHPILYQPTFISADGNLFFRGDILIKAVKRWRLIEIKSATKIKVPEHIYDVGFQYKVLHSKIKEETNDKKHSDAKTFSPYEKYNIEICIAYLNSNYLYEKGLDLSQLFVEENVNVRARLNQALIDRVLVQFNLALARKTKPQVDVGTHCYAPNKCKFFDYCWKKLPKNNIFSLSQLTDSKFNFLIERGITELNEIPGDLNLSTNERLEIDATIEQKERVNKNKIKSFLNKIEGETLLFIDVESISPAIPLFNKTRPNQYICYQYCVLIQNPHDNTKFVRMEFLAEPGIDPRHPFEKKYYYHPDFKGKFSIDVVTQLLSPEISYNALRIQNINTATQVLETLHTLPIEKQIIMKYDLLEYCYTDVLSMVHILKNLKLKVQNQGKEVR